MPDGCMRMAASLLPSTRASFSILNKHNYSNQSLMKTIASTLIVSTLLAVSVHAHCGRDFIIAEDSHVPQPWDGNILLNYEWEHQDGPDAFGMESGFMLGILPGVGFGADVGFRDEAEGGWEYSLVRPRVLINLVPAGTSLPFRAALNLGYQFANGNDQENASAHADASNSHGHEHHHEAAMEMPEAPEHQHGGVHNHDQDLLAARLILEADVTDSTRLVFNLICNLPDGSGPDWGYAAGIRQRLTQDLAAGVEAIGDFDSEGYHQIVGAVYFTPVSLLTLKLGAGFGLTEASPDFALHAGLNFRF